jgi:class 3 adenylate cyclase/tetratricopeptide (TPR) repeat protein
MQCPRCSQSNPQEARFCLGCGNSLQLKCVQCSTDLPANAKFCFSCGTAVEGTAPRSAPGALQNHTPRHLAEKILTSRTSLEGERKQVTVLFADLKGSLEAIADRDPEEARALIDPVLEKMMEAVHRYEGTVNQIQGDGIMALFGAPVSHEDHAVRACYAALAMQAAMRRHNEELRRAHGAELRIRVGLNSGEVVVRAIGNDLSMDYSAVGPTTHLAARMEQLATPGSIRLTGETLRLSEGFVHVTALGPVPVKGLEGPVEVFELTGASTVRTRVQAAAARGLTRFVGRQTELEAMRSAMERAGRGHGEIVALVGEPGVGKSRLVWEFTHSHRLQGWETLESASVSYGKATAYRPLIDLMRGYFQIADTDDARRVREKVTGKLLTLDKTLEPTLPAFLTLLDVPFENPEWQGLGPSLRRQRILEACKRLLLRESQVQPLVVVFEDLHWIDAETQAFLDSLADSLPTSRILLTVNYRPEYEDPWTRKTYYTLLRIDPLPAESAEELLAGLLGDAKELQPLRRLLIERTEGNPFFLEESVRTMLETNVLAGERGQYKLAMPLAGIQMPSRVQALLSARIDRLPAEHKHLLQTAAVIGKDVPFTLLQAIVNMPDESLRLGLAQLQTAEFVYETALFPDLEYTFKHALTHEVAYSSMLQERRRVVHALIAKAMETLYSGRLTEHVERLSQHAFRGQLWQEAVQYLKQAGDKALARSAIQEAVAYFDQALKALQQLPNNPVNTEQAIDLRLELRNALHPLGEFDRVLDILRDAQSLAEGLDDQRRLGRVYGFLAQSFRLRGEYAAAIEVGGRAAVIGQRLKDLNIQATANFHLGQIHFQLAAHASAAEMHNRNIDLLQGDLAKQRFGMAGFPVVFSRGHCAWSLTELGRFSEAIGMWEEAARIAETVKHGYSQAFAEYCGGYLYLRKGDIDRALIRLEHGFNLCKAMNFRQDLPFVSAFLGSAYALGGRLQEATPLLEHAVDAMVSMKLVANRSWLLTQLAQVYLLDGQTEDASSLVEEALELASRYEERGWEAWGLHLKGEILAQSTRSQFERALEAYDAAAERAEGLKMKPLMAHCDLSRGKVYGRTGDKSQADKHLSLAVSSMREMDMRFWLHSAEQEHALLHA